MEFSQLDKDLTITILLAYLVSAFLGWVIFYYTIKAAVKNGMKEAQNEKEISRPNIKPERVLFKPEIKPNSEQEKLRQLYDTGQITFEEYQKEWVNKGY